MADDFYSFQQENKVSLPMDPSSFVIDKREWGRLNNIVNNCKSDKKWFKSIAFCFFGISGSAFITWLSLLSQKDIGNVPIVLLIVAIVSLIIGGLCLFVQYYLNKNIDTSIQNIKDELKYIEDGIR